MKFYLQKNNNRRGFTLIELLVVISIIALLSSVIMVAVQDARSKSKAAKLMSDMIQIRNAAELYKTDTGSYPAFVAVLVPQYIPQTPINPFDSTIKYALRIDSINSYCSGKDLDPSEYEPGKLSITSGAKISDAKKEWFSKFYVLSGILYDGTNANATMVPCVE